MIHMLFKKIIALAIISFSLLGCQTTVDKSNEIKSQQEQINQQRENTKEKEISAPDVHTIEDEPFYNKEIAIGYSGSHCQMTAPIALAQGYFDELGVKAEIIKVDNQIDAVGTGKVQLTTKHIAETIVPTASGLDIYFTRGAHNGCTNLYVSADSDFNSTQDLVEKKSE